MQEVLCWNCTYLAVCKETANPKDKCKNFVELKKITYYQIANILEHKISWVKTMVSRKGGQFIADLLLKKGIKVKVFEKTRYTKTEFYIEIKPQEKRVYERKRQP